MRRILVLGGYGTFGSRIVRLLAARKRWSVVVAGRSLERAQDFAAGLDDPAITGVALDRDTANSAALQALDPWLVIDASGPFQGAAARGYPIVRAALAIGAHYIDIADARDFVTGIVRFDAEAKGRDRVVVSGASSVPTLSSAVVAALTEDMDAVLEIETAISSSNQATLGRSVHAALLSYAGKSMPTYRFGQRRSVPALQNWRHIEVAVPEREPLGRIVAPCDVPDLDLLPARYLTLRKAAFQGGTELALLNRCTALLARLVSWRLIPDLSPLASAAGLAFGLLRRFGSTRSGMIVDVKGRRGTAFIARRWSVIAEQGDGLWIPAMAAALLAEKLDRGELAAGAHAGVDVLSLDEFRRGFAGLHIRDAVTEQAVPVSPLRTWVGDAVDRLPLAIRRLHDDPLERSAAGTVDVIRGEHPFAQWICRLVGFPDSAPDQRLRVEFEPDGAAETWRRRFEHGRFVSRLAPWPGKPGFVRERIGPFTHGFRLVTSRHGLRIQFRRWWCFGVPLPRRLGPRVVARQWEEGGCYCFRVEIGLPWIGRVIGYRGRLRLDPA